jgi:hypothetical protein
MLVLSLSKLTMSCFLFTVTSISAPFSKPALRSHSPFSKITGSCLAFLYVHLPYTFNLRMFSGSFGFGGSAALQVHFFVDFPTRFGPVIVEFLIFCVRIIEK